MCAVSRTKAGEGTLSSTGTEEIPIRRSIEERSTGGKLSSKKIVNSSRMLVFGRRHRPSERREERIGYLTVGQYQFPCFYDTLLTRLALREKNVLENPGRETEAKTLVSIEYRLIIEEFNQRRSSRTP